MASEFSIIQQYFQRPCHDTDLAGGDDAALIHLQQGEQLAVSSDMLVSGRHFFADAEPYDIGWKAMAVNISDMAAMGAQAKWATLAIALPQFDAAWLQGFAQGLFDCAEAYQVSLIGGDTTRGPLNICVQIMGVLPRDSALQRSHAKLGDEIWHSGQLGSAAYALQQLLAQQACPQAFLPALHRPQPRQALGLALRGLAHSAIDISDGLLADLSHILQRSQVGADIHWPSVRHDLADTGLSLAQQQQLALSGGDDYELCFTAPAEQHQQIAQLAQQLDIALSCIGQISAQSGLRVWDAQQQLIALKEQGYDHFQAS
jgi:thiamine-monophosphate kinase